jgi:lactoylglutathione lyase
MASLSVLPNLYTADVDQATAFYRDLLGGVQTFQYPASGPAEHVELRVGETIIALTHHDAVREAGLPEPTTGHPLELVVSCDSADDTVAALRAAGTQILIEPHDHVAGHRRAYVTDPDGNWITLVSRSRT